MTNGHTVDVVTDEHAMEVVTGGQVVVRGVGILAPGLPNWPAARAVLAGEQPWQPGDVALPAPPLLAPNERRRAGAVIRLALAAAAEAVAASGVPVGELHPVFASSGGDAPTVTAILEAITQPGGAVSPTQFHNSVHNAPAGYWSIGTASGAPVTCLGGHDWSFGAALLAATAACAAERTPMLLCVYDAPMPPPLDAVRPVQHLVGIALVLAPEGDGPRLRLGWSPDPADAPPLAPALRPLATANPAARALRFLEAYARGQDDRFAVAVLDGHLDVQLAW